MNPLLFLSLTGRFLVAVVSVLTGTGGRVVGGTGCAGSTLGGPSRPLNLIYLLRRWQRCPLIR